VIEVFLLPEDLRCFLGVEPTSLDLECFHERQEIAGRLCAFCQKMEMVWHDAIGMNREISRGAFGAEDIE
jgi:hypothetical protein